MIVQVFACLSPLRRYNQKRNGGGKSKGGRAESGCLHRRVMRQIRYSVEYIWQNLLWSEGKVLLKH
jgi:hypothetical protein